MIIDRRRFLSRSSAAIAVWLPLARVVPLQQPIKSQALNVRDYGALGDGVSNDSAPVQAAIRAARGRWLYFPQGTYRISSIEAASARIFGDGVGATRLELSSNSSESLFTVDDLALHDVSASDRGRKALARAKNPNIQLFRSKTSFQATNCAFHTDRSVLSQSSSLESSSVVIRDCLVGRLTTAQPGDQDRMNIFTCGAEFLHFRNLRVAGLAARSIINATYRPDQRTTFGNPSAIIEDCRFEYIHNVGNSEEVKVVFLQNYEGIVRYNRFLDCFGRHIDLLGDPGDKSSKNPFLTNLAIENEIRFSNKRQNSLGSRNDEAGSIYCRYANARIVNNLQDFSNLKLSSARYHGISVRHGYEAIVIEKNTVIGAKGHAIEADISDAVDTDNCDVSIIENDVSSVRSTRAPISVVNNSKDKFFGSVVIRDNAITYVHDKVGIVFERAAMRDTPFTIRKAELNGNINRSFGSRDAAFIEALPLELDAPDTDFSIKSSRSARAEEMVRKVSARSRFYTYRSLRAAR